MTGTIAAVVFLTLVVSLVLTVPIGFSLGIASLGYILYTGQLTPGFIAQNMVTGCDSFPTMAIPFFIFAGELMGGGGISKRLLNLASVFFGRIQGGLAIVTVVVCMFFAAISGSGPATVAAVGGMVVPTMLEKGYDKKFVLALIAAAGSIGVIIPPSIPMVIYGVTTNSSVSSLFLAGFVLLQSNMKTNGVVLSSIFMKLGLLVPIVLSVFLFGELPTVLQIIGFCMAVGAIVLINYEKNSKNSKSSKGSKVRKISKNSKSTVSRWSLVILLLAGGSCDAMAKVFEEWGPVGMGDPFLFYTFAIALLLSVALATWKNERPGKWEWLFGVVIAVPNFYSAKFLLMSLGSVPGVIAYPTYSVATILLVTLAGVFIFREKLKKRHWIAFAIILGALILLNI